MPFFKQHPCCLTDFFSTAKRSQQERPLAAKVLNRKKWLILGSFRMYPFKLHSNGVLAICPKNKPFFAETLKAENSGGATKAVSAKPMFLLYLSHVCSPIIYEI